MRNRFFVGSLFLISSWLGRFDLLSVVQTEAVHLTQQ